NAIPSDGALGAFTGAIPMVGFGAAAYILALLDRAGVAAEQHECEPPIASTSMPDGGGGPSGGDRGCTFGPRPDLTSTALLASLLLGLGAGCRKRFWPKRRNGEQPSN